MAAVICRKVGQWPQAALLVFRDTGTISLHANRASWLASNLLWVKPDSGQSWFLRPVLWIHLRSTIQLFPYSAAGIKLQEPVMQFQRLFLSRKHRQSPCQSLKVCVVPALSKGFKSWHREWILGAEEWHQVFRYTSNECFLFKLYWFSCTVHGAAKMRSVPWFCVPHQSNGNLRRGTTRPSGRRLTEMFENRVDEFHGRTQSPRKDTVTLSWSSPRLPLLD